MLFSTEYDISFQKLTVRFIRRYSVILISMIFEVIIHFIGNMYTSGHQQKAWTFPVNTTP